MSLFEQLAKRCMKCRGVLVRSVVLQFDMFRKMGILTDDQVFELTNKVTGIAVDARKHGRSMTSHCRGCGEHL